MDLEFEVESIDAVPEALRPFYTEKDGKHVLSVKGAVSKSKLEEFRQTNVDLMNKVKKLEPVVSLLGEDGLNPEKLNQRISSLAETRVTEMKTTYESQVSELTTKKSDLEARLSNLILTDEVTKKALKHGVVESALEDVVNRAKASFTVDETGKLVAKEGLRNKKGEPLSVEDWVTNLAETAKHFFGETRGGGATKPAGTGAQPALSTNEKLAAGLHRAGILK